MATYGATPAGDVRRAIADDSLAIKGDAGHSVDAMITAADAEQPPFRLVLGSTAYTSISKALTERLRELETQRAVAFSADTDGEDTVR